MQSLTTNRYLQVDHTKTIQNLGLK